MPEPEPQFTMPDVSGGGDGGADMPDVGGGGVGLSDIGRERFERPKTFEYR